MKTTKKLIALLLSAVMLLSLLAGCGETAPKPSETKAPSPQVPILSGMLVLNANATFEISYDQDGMVMELAGANEEGSAIVAEYDFSGKSCSTAVKELITASAEATLLREVKNVVVKLAIGSQLPSETFLDGIANDAANAVAENACTASVVAIGLDGLDEEGYINAENAQNLLKNALGVTEFESYSGDGSPHNDYYTVTVKAGDVEGTYQIDAVTGAVFEAVEEETGKPDYIEEEEFDASFEENIEETIDDNLDEDIPEEEPTV